MQPSCHWRDRRSARQAPALLHVGTQALDLVLHLLELPLLVAEQPPELAILLDHLRACGTATEREEQHRHAGRTQRHWPRITEWTRRFRAQHGSLSSWQSGNSFP